jgi:hypothetical protein
MRLRICLERRSLREKKNPPRIARYLLLLFYLYKTYPPASVVYISHDHDEFFLYSVFMLLGRSSVALLSIHLSSFLHNVVVHIQYI